MREDRPHIRIAADLELPATGLMLGTTESLVVCIPSSRFELMFLEVSWMIVGFRLLVLFFRNL